jgi:glutathione S-transferase
VDARLNNGRRFLVGERFTAADLTFAALAAPMLFPFECRAAQPALDTVPAEMREEVSRLRDTDAGRFALRMFSQERAAHPPIHVHPMYNDRELTTSAGVAIE